jgi:TetR/AcrR family transcriptional regulator
MIEYSTNIKGGAMNKKEEIMKKALQLFAEEGYEHIGVQRIVHEVGVTKPTLYHYFGSKEGLLNSIMTFYTDVFYRKLAIVIDYQQDIQKTIQEVIHTYIESAKKAPLFFMLQNHLRKAPILSPSRQIVREQLEGEHTLILNLFHQVAAHHTGLKGQEEFLTITFLGLVVSFIEVQMDHDSMDQISEAEIHKLSKQFLYGIFSL